jgi:signal transduction histidine kinase
MARLPEYMRTRQFLLLALLAFIVNSPVCASKSDQPGIAPRRILVLYWYNQDFRGNIASNRYFRAALKSTATGPAEYFPTLWELHKWRMLAALAVCVLAGLLIMALFFERGRRGRADQKRRLLEEKFATAFRSSPDAILVTCRSDQELTSQLIRSQEEERQRIAGELHDSLGQGLMIIKNRVLICLRDTTDRERVSEQLEEILTTVTATIEETRLISHNLRPYELDRLGLIAAVEAMLDKISRSTSLRVSSDFDSIDGLLSREVEVGVYRIVQEGLTNVLKHAQATEARVTIKRAGAQLIVTVMDNGNRSGSQKAASNRAGFGLTGIAHRARMLGGTYEFRSVPDGGFLLLVTAKIYEAANER